MLRELLALGRALGGDGLEAYVQSASGSLYLLDLYPKERRARLVPYELDPEKCRRFLWVGDPPASNAPRDRATTRRLAYLLGQVPTRLAEDPALKALLQGFLWDPGRPGGKARFLLDLRGYALEGAEEAQVGPFLVKGGRLELAAPWDQEEKEPKNAGELAEAMAEVLQRAWGVDSPQKGKEVLFSLALEGKPLADFPEYRDYLKRLLEGKKRFSGSGSGLCHGCGKTGVPVVGRFADFRLKFYITDKKSFAPGVWEGAFPRAYALCGDCFRDLQLGERFVLENLSLRFLETQALVLPVGEAEPGRLSKLVERVLAQVRGLERLAAWKAFLERAERWEEGYLGFSLLFFRKSQAATKAEEVVLEVPPSRVEALFAAMEGARGEGFPVEGVGDWLYLLPLDRSGREVRVGPALKAASHLFLGVPFHPGDWLPLFLQAAERAFREDATLFAATRYRGPGGTLDLVALGAGWIRVLRGLGLWGGSMEAKEMESAFPLEEEAVFRAYGFGPLEAGLYLLGRAMEVVGQAQARLYEYQKEPLLEAVGWQGMSLVRVRHLAAEVMAKATYYLDGEDRTRVLDLLGRATDLLERGRGGLSDREVPYYILMGYAQARSERLRARKKEVAHG